MLKKIFIILFFLFSIGFSSAYEIGQYCKQSYEDLDNFYSESLTGSLKASSIDYSKDRLFAYYPEWNRASYDYTQIPYDKFDIFLHAFVRPRNDGTLYIPDNIIYPEFISKVHSQGKKALISIGGYSNSRNFADIMRDDSKRQIFFDSIKDLMTKQGYDGIDLDWEFPSNTEEGELYLGLLKSLKVLFPDKIITTAVHSAPNHIYVDICRLQYYVDFIFFMAYDIEGWQGFAGYNAPLYRNQNMSKDRSIYSSLISNYLPYINNPKKIILGYPLYSKTFYVDQFYKSASYSNSTPYGDVEEFGCTRSFDDQSLVPKATCGDHVISYDNPLSYYYKLLLSQRFGLGGMFFWSLGDDKNKVLSKISLSGDFLSSLINDDIYLNQLNYYRNILPAGYPLVADAFMEKLKTAYSGNYVETLNNIESNIIRVVYEERKLSKNKDIENLLKYMMFRIINDKYFSFFVKGPSVAKNNF